MPKFQIGFFILAVLTTASSIHAAPCTNEAAIGSAAQGTAQAATSLANVTISRPILVAAQSLAAVAQQLQNLAAQTSDCPNLQAQTATLDSDESALASAVSETTLSPMEQGAWTTLSQSYTALKSQMSSAKEDIRDGYCIGLQGDSPSVAYFDSQKWVNCLSVHLIEDVATSCPGQATFVAGTCSIPYPNYSLDNDQCGTRVEQAGTCQQASHNGKLTWKEILGTLTITTYMAPQQFTASEAYSEESSMDAGQLAVNKCQDAMRDNYQTPCESAGGRWQGDCQDVMTIADHQCQASVDRSNNPTTMQCYATGKGVCVHGDIP